MLSSKKIIVALVTICFYSMVMSVPRPLKPLKILFVVSHFPAPSQPYILNMMVGLIDKGHEVSIFAFRRNQTELHSDIEKHSLMDRVIYEQFPPNLPECDIVFCQSATWGKMIIEMSSLNRWLRNKKIVVCLRGLDITGNNIKQDPQIYDKLFKRCNLFLPVCDYFKKIVVELGCNPDKVVVHHSAINSNQFFFKPREKINRENAGIRFISVSRLVEKKGLEYAIRAFAETAQRYPNVYFTIVGSGHLLAHLKALAKMLNVADKINFFGWATQEQVVDILDKSHIFLLPSVTAMSGDEEGIANALKEAMAMGLIPIGTFHAGTPELIEEGVSGFLVPEKDTQALAEKIRYVIKHPSMWRRIGLAARKKIEEEFEIKKTVEQLEKLFYGLVR